MRHLPSKGLACELVREAVGLWVGVMETLREGVWVRVGVPLVVTMWLGLLVAEAVVVGGNVWVAVGRAVAWRVMLVEAVMVPDADGVDVMAEDGVWEALALPLAVRLELQVATRSLWRRMLPDGRRGNGMLALLKTRREKGGRKKRFVLSPMLGRMAAHNNPYHAALAL